MGEPYIYNVPLILSCVEAGELVQVQGAIYSPAWRAGAGGDIFSCVESWCRG